MKKPEYTIIYVTNRSDCLFDWFLDSVLKDMGKDASVTQLVLVDIYCGTAERSTWMKDYSTQLKKFHSFKHTIPKPNVWAGGYKLTSVDYFAPSAFRNTGLLWTEADHVTFIDDVSVVCPGWWDYTKQSKKAQEIYLGTYDKHWHMNVVKGILKGSDCRESGLDTRRTHLKEHHKEPFYCHGTWMYGCSLSAPLEAFLQINGYDEDCDSMGSEDYVAGIMLEAHGWKFKFCMGMKTIESEEYHRMETPAKRIIKKVPAPDASHAILNMVRDGGRTTGAFYCSLGMNLRECREHVLKTKEMPITKIPEHDWRDGQPLSEM